LLEGFHKVTGEIPTKEGYPEHVNSADEEHLLDHTIQPRSQFRIIADNVCSYLIAGRNGDNRGDEYGYECREYDPIFNLCFYMHNSFTQ